jgi:hypothetical protein
VFAGALLLGAAACHATGTFACDHDDQCGAGGRCETTGYCSFADEACASGSRYDTYAGGELANRCVTGRDAVSCETLPPTCGPAGTSPCCDSPTVEGGPFARS